MKIGDLVIRTGLYRGARRPTGIIVGWPGTSRSIVTVLWGWVGSARHHRHPRSGGNQ